MTRIYLIRHGDAYDELGIQLQHYPLNNKGRIQALQLAKRLKNNKFDAVYCSKIKRTIETCEIVNDFHGQDVIYTSALNEVGSDNWPQPGALSSQSFDIANFDETVQHAYTTFKKMVKRHLDKEVLVFTHGNWIRALLCAILAKGSAKAFTHFIIHNSSLTIIDVDEANFEYIISVSDAAHTHLYGSHI